MQSQIQYLPWMDRWVPVDGVRARQGGQGSIKQVRGMTCGRVGALKEMLPDPVDRDERRRRMRQEVAGLVKVQGDGVPEVFDSNASTAADAEELFLVQAWIDGSNLQQYVTKPLSIDRSLELALSLARIIERCHANGDLHRDIKPENIIVGNDQKLYLVDFGIAWLPLDERDDDAETRFGQELGNRFLRLPEMAAGQLRNNPRSDVTFIVGILFYLLTNEYPRTLSFGDEGLTPHEHLRHAFPAVTLDDPRMTRLNSVFDVGFQYAPNLRFQSAAQLIERIEEIRTPRPTTHAVDMAMIVAQYEEMMQERETAQRHKILLRMREAAVVFEQRVRELSQARHLIPVMMAGSPIREADSWITTIRFKHVTENQEVESRHVISMQGSEIVCSSSIDSRHESYYIGAVADTVRLKEEVGRYTEHFFASILQEFVSKVATRRSFMSLIDRSM